MARNFSTHAAEQGLRLGFVDLGLSDEDGHTAFSSDPITTAMSAFIDYLYLMDADIIVRTGSSFSGTVVKIKGMQCTQVLRGQEMPVDHILVCTARNC